MKLLQNVLSHISKHHKGLNAKLKTNPLIASFLTKLKLKNLKYISMEHYVLMPPAEVKHMTTLDKSAFTKVITVPSITVDTEKLNLVLKISKKYLLKLLKFNSVLSLMGEEEKKQIVLNPVLIKTEKDTEQIFEKTHLNESIFYEFSMIDITVHYENWKCEQILRSVLPDDSEGSSSYSIIGHILHLNLREHLSKYKWLIAQVYLDKTPNVTMVVNKIENIDTSDNTYRSFSMEKLAGESDDMVTTVRENGCLFTFDFSKVYWNPRLSTEHERIIKKLKAGDVLFDVMSGVGPFAIPSAKRDCVVFANDLNPLSFESLKKNCVLNKVQNEVHCFNMDGKEFIKTEFKREVIEYWNNEDFSGSIHITMNLPSIAVDFLPHFMGLFSREDFTDSISKKLSTGKINSNLPLIHVYLFSYNETKEFAVYLVASKLGYCLEELSSDSLNIKDLDVDLIKKSIQPVFWSYVVEVVNVRRVAPAKVMMRVSFYMPFEVLFPDSIIIESHPLKKLKLSFPTE